MSSMTTEESIQKIKYAMENAGVLGLTDDRGWTSTEKVCLFVLEYYKNELLEKIENEIYSSTLSLKSCETKESKERIMFYIDGLGFCLKLLTSEKSISERDKSLTLL